MEAKIIKVTRGETTGRLALVSAQAALRHVSQSLPNERDWASPYPQCYRTAILLYTLAGGFFSKYTSH